MLESFQEEEKGEIEQIDTSTRPNLQKEDSWQVQMNLFAQMEEFQKCSGCKLNITPQEERE